MSRRCMGCMEIMEQDRICDHCGFDQTTLNKNYQLPVGTLLDGRYTIGKVLGQGGFGITYLGWDNDLDIKVAIKEFYPSGAVMRDSAVSTTVKQYGGNSGASFLRNRERFLNEAKALAKFSEEPGIVHVFSFFEENNTAYIIMEYLPGMTLKAYARQQGGKLPAKEVWELIRPAIDTLKKVHRENIVHRDISPDNLMLLPDGRVKLLDFGALRVVEHADKQAQLTSATEAILKAGYAPMEQYQNRGSLGPWTDVYALCATIGYLLSGQVPPESLDRVTGEADETFVSQYPGITKRQRQALEAGLAIRPENRISSMEELERALFSDSGKIKTGKRQGKKKRGVPAMVATGMAAIAVVFAFLAFFNGSGEKKPVSSDKPDASRIEAGKKDAATQNVLIPVDFENLDSGYGPFMVPGTDLPRENIKSIHILDSFDAMPQEAWDVSQNQDGTVMAWVTPVAGGGYRLHIAGEGGVWAPENCHELFANYINATAIEFNGAFHTENVYSFSLMFLNCHSLFQLDLRGFNTGNVRSMGFMFAGCYSLDSLDISGFDTRNVDSMVNMFSFSVIWDMTENGGLKWNESVRGGPRTLDLSHFDTSNVTNFSGMFGGAYLDILDISSFDFSNASRKAAETNDFYILQLGVPGFELSELYLPEEIYSVSMDDWLVSEDCEIYYGVDWKANERKDATSVQDPISGTLMNQTVTILQEDPYFVYNDFAHKLELLADTSAFGTPLLRSSVVSIVFLNTISDASEDAWDVSRLQDRSVLAWADKQGSFYVLYIAAEGGVYAPADSSGLFAYYRNLEQIQWNDAFHTDRVTDMEGMFLDCEMLSELDLDFFDTSHVKDMSQMFKYCYNLESLDTGCFDTSSVTDMTEMFAVGIPSYSEEDEDAGKWISRTFESKLKTLDLGHLDTSSVQSMNGMFCMCNGLESLNILGFQTENVKDFSNMFYECSRLKQLDVSSFDTANARNMESMFSNCRSLQTLNVRNFNTANVTNMKNMFDYCDALASLDLGSFDTGNVTDMSGMFSSCNNLSNLNLSSFNTSNVTDMSSMFWFCEKLGYLNLSNFNTSKVTDMSYMFHACTILNVNVSSFDTSNVTDMRHMFYSCRSIPDVSHFDTSNVTNYDNFVSPYTTSDRSWMEIFVR